MTTFIDLDSVWRDRTAYPNPCDYELLPGQVNTWTRSSRDTRALPANPNERPLDFVNSINLISATLPYPRIEIFALNTIVVDSITGGNTMNTILPHNLVVGDIVMTSSPGYANSSGILRNVEYHVIAPVGATTFQLSLTAGGPAIVLINGTGLNLLMGAVTVAEYATVFGNLDAATQLINFPRLYIDFHSRQYADTRLIKTIGGILADAKFVIGIDRVQLDDTLTPTWIHYKSHGEQVFRFKRDDPMVVRIMTRDGTTIPFFTEANLALPTNPQRQTMLTFGVTPFIKDASYVNQNIDPIG
jgi:hypothetical protein